MRSVFLISIILQFVFQGAAQTLGGNSVYNFLKLPNTPQLTALGGINISGQSNDIGMVWGNPALLRASMHTQANFVFNAFYAGIGNYHALAGYRYEPLETSFALGVNYFSYGAITGTDAAGNVLGEFRPSDYVIQAAASRQYRERWHYGAALKFIHSNYGAYRSSGVAMDAGVTYTDTANFIQASLVAKNMGVQITPYTGTEPGDLPFDLQLGISKRLAKAPIQFSITAHHLQRFNIRYSDTAFDRVNGYNENVTGKKYIFDKLFRHIVVASQLYIGDKLEISLGYNYLRRKELNISNSGNGLNGFSLGLGILLNKIQIRYARSYYQNNTAWNQVGLNLKLNDYFGAANKW